MTRPVRMLKFITEQIAAGRTIYVSNQLRHTVITPATFAKWEAAGRTLFKLDAEGRLRMARGRTYDIIDLCRVSAA